jgi:hypothetical protein
MDGACSMHVGDEKCIQNFSQKTRREEVTFEGTECRWEDKRTADLKETGSEDVD